MNLFGVLQISASALKAERMRAEVVASNLANVETTRTPDGGPYRRRAVVFRSANFDAELTAAGMREDASGVEVSGIATDATAPILRYEPSHPDANSQGYVAYPAINPVQEMVDLMGAARAYELNASAVGASKQMIQQSIDILRA